MLDKTQLLTFVRRNNGTTSPWTPERIEELRRLAETKLSGSEIGALMGMTRNAIIGKCDREGIGLHRAQFNRGSATSQKIRRKLKRNYVSETKRRSRKHIPEFLFQDTANIEPLRISVGDLEPHHCRAVMDETDDSCCKVYCGHQMVYKSFCAAHASVYYRWGRR